MVKKILSSLTPTNVFGTLLSIILLLVSAWAANVTTAQNKQDESIAKLETKTTVVQTKQDDQTLRLQRIETKVDELLMRQGR